MKIFKISLIVLAVVLAVSAAVIIPHLPRIALRIFADTYSLDLRYKDLKQTTLSTMIIDGLTVSDRSRGIGIASANARIGLTWNGPDPRNASVGFDLRDVRFIKKAAEKASSYDTLDGLVALPFSSNWTYQEISGKVRSLKGGVEVKDFMAKSDLIRLSVNGVMNHDNTIKSDIVIYFSDELTRKIPPELTKLVLTPEDPGWKSLSVKLEGNYTMPTIQVSSKLFRLNIGVKED